MEKNTAHAAKVSRTLKAAGFTKSTSHRSMVRGLPARYEGFIVRAGVTAARVEYYRGTDRRPFAEARDAHNAKIARYADALSAAGFDVEVQSSVNDFRELVVRAGGRA
jgi:hypothetical protein